MDNCFCGQTRAWHDENKPRHQFQAEGSSLKKADEDNVKIKTPRFPSDPILRFALIEKGVISTEDLDAAEKKLNALGSSGITIAGVPPTG